jgi:ATP-binding cassette subfamily B protein
MSSSRDDLPPALPSLWRTVKLGYRAEPKLLLAAFGMTIVSALPDVLLALWLRMLADAVTDGDRTRIFVAAIGLGVSATLMWWLQVVFDRLSGGSATGSASPWRARVAELHATVATIAHQERRHMDRLESCAATRSTWTTCSCRLFSTWVG